MIEVEEESMMEKVINILKPTYGVIIYQEQLMALTQVLAGFSLADADLMRRAMGKKDLEKMNRITSYNVCYTKLLRGASFTISSLGGIGGTGFTPIVNGPQVAILGLSRNYMKPFWDAEKQQFMPRLTLPFSLSYDHRVIDGAEAA